MNKRVAIVDYETGNTFGVKQALKYVGIESELTSRHKEILSSDGVILPGVGAFGPAIDRLKSLELDKIILEFVANGKPILGICLGMQLLFETSDEFGNHDGLGILKGKVTKFSNLDASARVPQTQWNKVHFNNQKTTLFKGMGNETFMYFVHSFYVTSNQPNATVFETDYCGLKYCSAIEYKNVFATQFHPERSAHSGLLLIKNFCDLI